MGEPTFRIVITEEREDASAVTSCSIERLSMRLDGPMDIPHIVSVLAAKKRAPRSDRGQARKKNTQPEMPVQ